MKEITRKLYTKPVMLGLAFLVAIGLAAGLFVTSRSRAAMTTYIQAGDDTFETTDNGESFHNFAASPIPAGFFGPNSQAYSGLVPLVGVPINPLVSDIDTVIHRNNDVYTPGTTSLTMTALNLRSINPITVSYTGGGTESWTVKVNLSDFQSSTGSMSISDGGTFDSSLKVWPKFTFTRVSDGAQRVLDTGSGSSLMAAGSDSDSASLQAAVISDGFEISPEPAPAPTVAPAPCKAVASDFESASLSSNSADTSAAASSSCPPVTLTSTNTPWQLCNGHFCIPRPLTEQELLASHNASPPGTKRALATKAVVGDR
jgi:hypothetical protein